VVTLWLPAGTLPTASGGVKADVELGLFLAYIGRVVVPRRDGWKPTEEDGLGPAASAADTARLADAVGSFAFLLCGDGAAAGAHGGGGSGAAGASPWRRRYRQVGQLPGPRRHLPTNTNVAVPLLDDAAVRATAAVASSDSVAAAAAAIMKAVTAATTLPRPRVRLPPLPILRTTPRVDCDGASTAAGVQRGRLTEGSLDDLSRRMHEMTGCQLEPASISVTLELHGYVGSAEAASV